MKVKELIIKLEQCDQEADIILDYCVLWCNGDDLAIDIINGYFPNLRFRYETVNSYKEEYEGAYEKAIFGWVKDPIRSKSVVVLSSDQYIYQKD